MRKAEEEERDREAQIHQPGLSDAVGCTRECEQFNISAKRSNAVKLCSDDGRESDDVEFSERPGGYGFQDLSYEDCDFDDDDEYSDDSDDPDEFDAEQADEADQYFRW